MRWRLTGSHLKCRGVWGPEKIKMLRMGGWTSILLKTNYNVNVVNVEGRRSHQKSTLGGGGMKNVRPLIIFFNRTALSIIIIAGWWVQSRCLPSDIFSASPPSCEKQDGCLQVLTPTQITVQKCYWSNKSNENFPNSFKWRLLNVLHSNVTESTTWYTLPFPQVSKTWFNPGLLKQSLNSCLD